MLLVRTAVPVEHALDVERAGFLQAMDLEAPEVSRDLPTPPVDADPRRVRLEVLCWARRWYLPRWAVEYAHDRIRRQREDMDPEWKGWLPLRGVLPPERLPFRFLPGESDAARRKRSAGYWNGVRGMERAAGQVNLIEGRDLLRVVRWQVLKWSPERIAQAEIAAGAKGDPLNRAEDIRDVVKAIAGRLGLRPRPPGAPGRRRSEGVPG